MTDDFSDQYKRQSVPDQEPDYESDALPDDEFLPEDEVLSTKPDDPFAFADPHMIRLGLTLDFGPGDLASNQDGVLSPAQIAQLDTDLRVFHWSIIAAAVVAAFSTSVIGAVFGLWYVLLLPVLLVGLAVGAAMRLLRERQRLPSRIVQHTTMRIGSVSLTLRRWGISDDEPLPVDGGKKVFGPNHLYKVVEANQMYLAYYAPVRSWRGYRLLSLEPMANDVPVKAKRKPKRKG